MTTSVDSKEGEELGAKFLDEQIATLLKLEPILRDSVLSRISKLHPLFASVIEDAISIRILGSEARLNQAYIISRALLERIINYCFLQISTLDEFNTYIDYSLNKAGRRLNRTIETNGIVKAKIELKKGTYELPEEIVSAIARFTSERGREKTRWTKVGLPERAAVIESEVGSTGLFINLLIIYTDASEALHGTLYGSLFHLGVYDIGAIPHDQESLDKQRYITLSFLYLMAGGAIDTLLALLSKVGESKADDHSKESKARFRKYSIETGLA